MASENIKTPSQMEPSKSNTSKVLPHGSMTTAGITNILSPQKNLTPDAVEDILSKRSTISLFGINPSDQKAVRSALQLLDWLVIPATYEQATLWISKTLAMFPRRDTTQDGVIVSTLARAVVEEGVSLIALVEELTAAWKRATRENPWFPPPGDLLAGAMQTTAMFKARKAALSVPMLAAPEKVEEKPVTPEMRRQVGGMMAELVVKLRSEE